MGEVSDRAVAAVAGSMLSQHLVARSALGAAWNQPVQAIFDEKHLRIVEEPFLTVVSLRKSRRQLGNSAVGNWLYSVGLCLPNAPNGLAGDAQLGCCWFEPRAWLVTTSVPIAPSSPEVGLLATTISDRLAALRLTGPAAVQVIAAGCNPDILRSTGCARTRFGDFATVLIQRWGDNDYRVLIDVSLARSLAGWLLETARTVEPDERGQ